MIITSTTPTDVAWIERFDAQLFHVLSVWLITVHSTWLVAFAIYAAQLQCSTRDPNLFVLYTIGLIELLGLFNLYADDSQMYSSCPVSAVSKFQRRHGVYLYVLTTSHVVRTSVVFSSVRTRPNRSDALPHGNYTNCRLERLHRSRSGRTT